MTGPAASPSPEGGAGRATAADGPARGPAQLTRRGVLLGGGAALGSGLLVACTGGSSHHPSAPVPTAAPVPPSTTSSTTAPGADQLSGDLALAARAAALENLFDHAYGAALLVVGADDAHPVGPALVTLVQTLQSQHRDHAAAWNAILTAAGVAAVTTADAALDASAVQPALHALTDAAALIALALQLERVAAATYLDAVEHVLATTGAIRTAAAIQPVEMGHVAILTMFQGGAPVPSSFATIAGSRALG